MAPLLDTIADAVEFFPLLAEVADASPLLDVLADVDVIEVAL